MSAIPSTASATASAAGYTASDPRMPVKTLGQDEFLKLLVTKMTSQDPMNPQGDADFIAQMAQFSTLEQGKSMSNDIAALTASGMIGREVTIKGEVENGVMQEDIKGVVNSIAIKDGSPLIRIGAEEFSFDRVTMITPYVPVSNFPETAVA